MHLKVLQIGFQIFILFLLPFLQCSSFSFHPFTIYMSCGGRPSCFPLYALAVWFSALPQGQSPFRCVAMQPICIPPGIFYSISDSGCAELSSLPPCFLLPCPGPIDPPAFSLSCGPQVSEMPRAGNGLNCSSVNHQLRRLLMISHIFSFSLFLMLLP